MKAQSGFNKIARKIRENMNNQFSKHNSHCNLFLDSKYIEIQREYNSGNLVPQAIAILRQFREIDSRIAPPKGDITADVECWNRFILSQEHCLNQNHLVSNLRLLSEDFPAHIIMIAAGIIDETIALVDARLGIEDLGKFLCTDISDVRIPITGFFSGPGTCANTQYTDLFSKFTTGGDFATSESCSVDTMVDQQVIVDHVLQNHSALKKLRMRHTSHKAIKNCYVPKKSDVSRDIVPQLNGDLFLQFPMGAFLEECLSAINIDLDSQPDINRECARLGSLYGDFTDTFNFNGINKRKPVWCTLDLTSASNIVGRQLCKLLFPEWVYRYMMATRCEGIVDCHSGDYARLECMATMGNAFCFPMQTFVFAAIARACNIVLGVPTDWVRVFGDDIIVDVQTFPLLIKVLQSLHMVPNKKKSFSSGHFRESCGGDYYKGFQVRPVSPRKFETLADVYAFTNLLLDWYEEQSLDISQDECACIADMIISLHLTFNKKRVKVLRKGARGNLPFFIVPRFANMSDGVRISSMTLADLTTGKLLKSSDDIQNDYILQSFGHFDSDLQTMVCSYSYLSLTESKRKISDEELQVFHFLRTSGDFRGSKHDEHESFFVSGRGKGRSVQRRTQIPFNQWDSMPKGVDSYVSLHRLTSERMLVAALCLRSGLLHS